ncbi:uncharacterized protein KY384_004448 [Bacidia gigantensis]|uniref:uncharacterized protein n=1 Tax=Bacidia gigantensis TaxID=2732470 RepID=UPI001D046FE5|nr:uncharacterized protein KY384_004448 [Bacidia gigantensis]KAG8531091.1 hypothetical protein KY384_004448 [Bacidia gigantensis]
MVGLQEIPRTATFTWSPEIASSYLATGTKSGAVDEGFSNDTQLELWDLALDKTTRERELRPIASISTDSRFNDIAWTKDNASESLGIIAGGLENGSLDLWDAGKLLDGQNDPFLSRTSKHNGSIKALQFNAFRSELLATVGTKGELFISDVNNVGSPFRMGNPVARADDLECLDWNRRTSHIMVTGSSAGIMTVWDIKNKKESLTLNNLGRKPISAVAWDPAKTTRLITAIPSDTDPSILVWDLRNANAPERVLKGHDGGVLSLSWCQQDSDLLLSCGKDNRNICWNPQTGVGFGEFPVVTNWTFQTKWNPTNPAFIATASFDGRIVVHPIQNTKSDPSAQDGGQNQALDDEDFFNKAQSQPQGAAFTLQHAPKWLHRPCGATFAFGGKIASFKSSVSEAKKRSVVRISTFAIDDTVVSTTNSFEASLTQGDLDNICDERIDTLTDEADKSDWRVIKLLTSQNVRKDLVDFLGFTTSHGEDVKVVPASAMNWSKGDDKSTHRAKANDNRLSAFFDSGADGDNFLSELGATKGTRTNNPFQLYSGSESESDQKITRALLLGKFEQALDVCLQEERMSDAFMIAICGGQPCIEKAQKVYFSQKEGGPNYLRLLSSVVGTNLWDLVHNADLKNWKDIMASLCTYAKPTEFPDLCESLGDRLEEHMRSQGGSNELRKDAAFCYLAGSKLEKVVAIWLIELQEKEISKLKGAGTGSGFSVHARALQGFVEKVTIFREVTSYKDDGLEATSDWKLAALYDKYIEYADIASAHGQLQVAARYLDLLPSKYSAADVAKARIRDSLRKPSSQPASRQPAATSRAPQKTSSTATSLQPEEQPLGQQQPVPAQLNPYAPPALPHNPYAPLGGQYNTPGYTNAGYQHQQPPPQVGMAYGGQYPSGPPGAPPRNASPSVPPPSKAANVGNWNDMPENFFKPPTASRRGTPGVGANGPPQVQSSVPPPNPNIGPPRSTPPPLGPPPKVGSRPPPRITSPPASNAVAVHQTERPSSVTNPYAPAPSSLPVQSQATIPRGPSPYNTPPIAPPPNSRYAPTQPALSPQVEPSSNRHGGREPPPPPANPYAPKQSNPPSQLPPTSLQQAQKSPTPLIANTPDSKPPRSQQQGNPVSKKYPPGDRSHIPSSAAVVYQILNSDMQRIKTKAPASFKAHVEDTEKRLNILFDHLNNEDLLKPDTITLMAELAQAIRGKDYERAQAIHVDIMTHRNDECGNWMVGVKRLIAMSRATP